MHSRAVTLSMLSVAMLVGCGGAGQGGVDRSAAQSGRIVIPSSDAGALPPGHPPVLPQGHPPIPALPEGHPPVTELPPMPPGDGFRCPGRDQGTEPVYEFAPSDGQNVIIST